MADAKSWRCPFCEHHATISEKDTSGSLTQLNANSKYGQQAFQMRSIVCPNPDCREITLNATVFKYDRSDPSTVRMIPTATWNLIPGANIRVFPDYVPSAIIADYREACLVRDGSPKASATLARRCLQGMIRDFWKVKPGRLIDEIESIRDRVDPATWQAVDAVRKIGNIGAHMEKDINVIVDVEPNEAALLIGLIETLIVDWYVAREERARRTAALVAAAQTKRS